MEEKHNRLCLFCAKDFERKCVCVFAHLCVSMFAHLCVHISVHSGDQGSILADIP